MKSLCYCFFFLIGFLPHFTVFSTELPKEFLRYQEDFQSAMLTFRDPKTQQEVILVGMIHVADPDFFVTVDQIAQTCDIVLREGVSGNSSIASFPFLYILSLQNRLTYLLQVQHQSQIMDSRADNWLTADIKLNEIRPSWQNVTLSYVTLPFVIVFCESYFIAEEAIRIISAPLCLRPTYNKWFRYYFYSYLIASDIEEEVEQGSLKDEILKKRNIHLLSVFDECRKEEKNHRILIPWGAAHLPEVCEELKSRGYQLEQVEWVPCVYDKHKKDQKKSVSSFYIPWLYSHSISPLYQEMNGPLGLVTWQKSKTIKYQLFSMGYRQILFYYQDKKQHCHAILNGGIYKYKQDQEKQSSKIAVGWYLYTKQRNPERMTTSWLLHNYVCRQETKEDQEIYEHQVGWWGWLYRSQKVVDSQTKQTQEQRIRILPSLWKYPLIYSYEQNGEKTQHRFLLFFKI